MRRVRKCLVCALACAGIAGLSYISSTAYLTDSGKFVNNFTTAKFSIDLTEPVWSSQPSNALGKIKEQKLVQGRVQTQDGMQ